MSALGYDLPQNLVTIFWIVLLLFWLLAALNAKRYAKRSTASWLGRVLIVAAVFAFYAIPDVRDSFVQAERILPLWLQWIGVVLSACGVAFAIWARVHLGRNWGMPISLKQDAELVTSGPYEYVRHPIYTGFLLAALGSCCVSMWWILPLILLSIYFVFAAKAEEKIMTAEFPQQYPEYMRRSKMLIPFLL